MKRYNSVPFETIAQATAQRPTAVSPILLNM